MISPGAMRSFVKNLLFDFGRKNPFIFSSSIIKAESESSLARFVIRNYDSTVLTTVGRNDPDFLIVEFL